MLNDGDYPQMCSAKELDRNMIKHAATNLKTAFTFEPEEPEDALTNASVYALKIFDPNPYSDRILTSTSRQIKKICSRVAADRGGG